jgi:hypothetical protein
VTGTPDPRFAEALLRGDEEKARALAGAERACLSALAELRALNGVGPAPVEPPVGELGHLLRTRRFVLAHDAASLARVALEAPPRIASLASGWARALAGESPELASRASERPPPSSSEALELALRVEALVLAAWPAWASDEDARALGLVREAAALAGRADQPHAQYLAYAALARARRRMGRVPMATRLLGSLLRGAPPSYARWLAWEARLVGLLEVRGPEPDAIGALLAAARAGPRPAFEAACASCAALPGAHASFRVEADAIAAALDPARDPATMEARARAFVLGERSDLLSGLEAIAIDPTDVDAPLAWVRIGPEGARRVLAPGAALAGRDAVRVEATERGGRTENAIVVLAAHAAGLDEDAFFRAVYGFTFKKAIHDGVLRVLLTRMRQALEPHASLAREGERLRLAVRAPFWILDPRVASRADNLVLRAIATERTVSAKEVAERTGLPLRTVQAELARLLDEGVCTRTKDGRSTEYAVEDTVVREPTRVITGVERA